jgi:hypothetical protein
MKLLNWQRNELFQELSGSGLNPNDFIEERTANDWYRIISRTNFEFRFAVMANNSSGSDNYSVSYLPSDLDVPSKVISLGGIKSWNSDNSNSCVHYFRKWLVAVKQELGAPDLWLESKKNFTAFCLNC